MSRSDPFEHIFPDLLENCASEVGDLIGESLELQEENYATGMLSEVFSSPKKKFGLAAFELDDASAEPAHLYFDLNLGIELAGRLVMLPAEEIESCKKQAKIDGEMFDAISEIANIIGSVINASFKEAFPKKKLHFAKGNLDVYSPKADDLPLATGAQTLLSGTLVLNGNRLGGVKFFLPASLVEAPEKKAEAEAEKPAEVSENAKAAQPAEAGAKSFQQTAAPTAGPEEAPAAAPTAEAGDTPAAEPAAEPASSGGSGEDTTTEPPKGTGL
ncbi:MAG: hypothetical protein ACQERN_13605, partial [Thermodesulfobacteriota bacterium]